MSLSTADLPLHWMPKGMSDGAASNQLGRSQNCHGAVAADDNHEIHEAVAAGDNHETGIQLPAVAVTVGLMHMHHLQGSAGCCQRTMLAYRTWTAVCEVRKVHLAAPNLGAVPGVLLCVWFEHRSVLLHVRFEHC